VARSQRPKSASTNKRGVAAEDINAALGRYLRDLERSPLAVRTRDAYGQHVRAYAAWLAGRTDGPSQRSRSLIPGGGITPRGTSSGI
jgi:hypothetical protein